MELLTLEKSHSSNSGFALVDCSEALLRWSNSWAELAGDLRSSEWHQQVISPVGFKHHDDHYESDAGYGSESSSRLFYLGSKTGSAVSFDDVEFCDNYEKPSPVHIFVDEHDDDEHYADDDDDEAAEDEDSNISIEMVGNECVLVNACHDDDIPCPTEASRDGLTPDINVQYDHEDLVDLACRFLAYFEGRKQDCVRPKIYWAILNAPDFGS